jgi:REP element-mobilizing transposase RayT
MVNSVIAKHAGRTGVQILGIGNAGNHLHLRAKFTNRAQYFSFIRAITGEIALKIKSRTHTAVTRAKTPKRNFWDLRPFSSIVSTPRYAHRLDDYVKINNLEGRGYVRAFARLVVEKWRDGTWPEFEDDVLIL